MGKNTEGFLSRAEGEELRRLATGKQVLELGCWKAKSTLFMAETALHVFSVDWFRGDDFAGKTCTLPEAFDNIKKSGYADRVTLISGGMRDVLPNVRICLFDFVFYDANHTYEDTKWVLTVVGAILRPKALIAVHDYEPGNPVWEPTVRAVNEFAENFHYLIRVVDRLAVLQHVDDRLTSMKVLG